MACSTAGPALITTEPLLLRNVAAVKVPPLVALMLPDWPRVPVVAIRVAGPLVTLITPLLVLSRLVCAVRLAAVTALTDPLWFRVEPWAISVALVVVAFEVPLWVSAPPAVSLTLVPWT